MWYLINLIFVLTLAGCVVSELRVPLPSYSGHDAAALYIERPYSLVGSVTGIHIVLDGKRIGTIGTHDEWIVKLAPGKHTVGTWAHSVTITLSANKPSCVEVGFGFAAQHGYIRPALECPPVKGEYRIAAESP